MLPVVSRYGGLHPVALATPVAPVLLMMLQGISDTFRSTLETV